MSLKLRAMAEKFMDDRKEKERIEMAKELPYPHAAFDFATGTAKDYSHEWNFMPLRIVTAIRYAYYTKAECK